MALSIDNRHIRFCVNGLGALFVAQATPAYAELGDFFLHQRVGIVESRGSLAKEYERPALQTVFSQSFRTFPAGIPLDLAHELSFYLDTFTTRGRDFLYFPLQPQSKTRVTEPALGIDVCAFSMSVVRLCLAGGFSLVQLQTSSDDYQRYVGLPATARIVIVPYDSIVVWEFGTRWRAIENRTEGYLNKHEDLFTFVSVGVAAIQSR